VLVEVVLSREGLLADLAGVHLLARVGDQVARKVLLAAEGLVAALLRALEGSQARVQLHVLGEMLFLLELTFAGGTSKG